MLDFTHFSKLGKRLGMPSNIERHMTAIALKRRLDFVLGMFLNTQTHELMMEVLEVFSSADGP